MARARSFGTRARSVGRPPSPYNESGLTGLRSFDGVVREEFLRVLSGPSGVRTYKEMASNDAVIGGLLHAAIQMMRKVTSSVLTNGESNREQEARKFIAECMNDMSFSWQDTQTEIFSMLTYGWSYFERVLKIRKGDSRDPKTQSKYSDGKVGFRKLAIRSQDTLDRWEIDRNGGIQGMWQQAAADSDVRTKNVFLPIDRCLLFRTVLNKNNPEGRSLLRHCYRSWFFKNNYEELVAIGVERDLVGLPTLKPPDGFKANTEENLVITEDMKRVLRNIRRDQQEGVLIPPGWELSLMSSPGKRQFDMESLMNYYDKRIAMSLLGQFIMLGMDRVGSFALSKTQYNDLFLLSMQGWLGSIDEVVNRFAIDELLKVNGYGDIENPPYLSHGRIQDYSLDELSVFITRVFKSGLLTPDDDLEGLLRMIAGLTEVPERSSVVREAGKKQMTHAPVDSKRLQLAHGTKITDTKSQKDRPADVEDNKARGFLVYVNDTVKFQSPSFLLCWEKMEECKKKYRKSEVGISQVIGEVSGGETRCEELVRYIPLKTLGTNNGHYHEWLKTRVGVMSGTAEVN